MKNHNIKSEDTSVSNEAYYIENGKQSDRDLFHLDSDSEITFDEYMKRLRKSWQEEKQKNRKKN